MADEKKTQIGTASPLGTRATTPQPAVPSPPATSPPPASGVATSYLPPVEDPLIGATLAGRYQISKKLGEGGMGAVYLATHNLLEKQVALKVLHGEFARKPDLVERFMQEAKAASRIRHENVIDISDFGSTPEGLVFFAMELLKGHDLHEDVARARLAGQLLPWPRTKKIFLQICSALTAAHDKGIIHRDLKPENIYLVEFLGDVDFVKLLDFGIAKLTEGSDGERKLTRTGMLFGTPEYMSPEQARGEQVDLRVDVYAMGCILFQLVTGRVPFEAENFMGVLSLHLTEAPPQIAPETFDHIGAPRDLGWIIDKALSKDRNQRWQTIAEFANAIRTACGDPIPTGVMQVAMANVSTPANPTSVRNATGPVVAVTPSPTPAPTTNRGKDAWTGSLQVPSDADINAHANARPTKSKLPLVLLGVAVLGGGGAAAVVVMSKKSATSVATDAGTGSNPIATVVVDAAASPPIALDAPPATPLPDIAEIHLDSVPQQADVFDVAGNHVVGKTPLGFKIPGSATSRQFILRKRGYSDVVLELVPNKPVINDTETLVKGAAGTQVTRVGPGVGSNPMTVTPDAGTGAVTKPDAASAVQVVAPPDASVKPPDPKPDCPPDEFPCLKQMPKDTPKDPTP